MLLVSTVIVTYAENLILPCLYKLMPYTPYSQKPVQFIFTVIMELQQF